MRDRTHTQTKTAEHLTETDERQCQEGEGAGAQTVIVSTVPYYRVLE